MAKAKFMNGEFSAKFKGKRKFVAEQMEAIKDYAARDDMQINICPVIQERPSGKKNTEEQITPTHFISGKPGTRSSGNLRQCRHPVIHAQIPQGDK